jgi:hypothetical protein
MRRWLSRVALATFLAGSVVLSSTVSLAQAQEEEAAAAPAGPVDPSWTEAARLLDEGRALMARWGRPNLDRACEILAQSYTLHQRGDTLLNLAECHRRQGKTATAWREFDEAIRFAIHLAFPEAIEAAIQKRDELAKTLSQLVVEVDTSTLPKTLEVTLDGKRLPEPQWNQTLYVDPGTHVVTATGPDHEPFEARTEVPPKGGRAVLKVTPRAIPKPPPAPPPAPPPPPPPTQAPPREPEEAPVWPYFVGGAGLVSLGVAAIFLADSRSASSELDDQCTEERQACPVGYDFSDARGRELRGFGFFVGLGVAGVGATTAGILGLLLSGSSDEGDVAVAPWLGPTGAGVTVRGATW